MKSTLSCISESGGYSSKGGGQQTADVIEFPAALGPFTVSRADLSKAFKKLSKLHPTFPKPDLASGENIKIGVDYPTAAGSNGGDTVFCQLSPAHPIDLDTKAKAAGSIPENATHFAWGYPWVPEPGLKRLAGDAEIAFVENGGFVYFDNESCVVGIDTIIQAPPFSSEIMFGRPQPLSDSIAQTLTRNGRFQEVILPSMRTKGATDYAWIRPSEFSDDIANPDGCFAYKFADGRLTYFPVVHTPIFTKDCLATETGPREAGVVVRQSPPNIEKIVNEDYRVCPICMDDSPADMLALACSHKYHSACIEGQLSSRWTGKRISFNYLNCAECRKRIAHPRIDLSEHLAFREIVAKLCLKRAREDGFDDFDEAVVNSGMDAEEPALQTMVAYECKSCAQPFCGGRIDCVAEEEIDMDLLKCTPCMWKEPSERKCREHGPLFAIYKCDSCCAIAVYDCSGNHYCRRCHGLAGTAKNFPCPGPGLCPLGVPHSPNTEGRHGQQYKAFVLNCSKCFAKIELADYVSQASRDRF